MGMTVFDTSRRVMYGQDMGERRVETVQVRLTTAEKEALEARAAAVHLSVSEYIRRDLNDRPAQPQRLEPLDTLLERGQRVEQASSSGLSAPVQPGVPVGELERRSDKRIGRPPAKRAGLCEHRVPPGSFCKFCDG